MKRKIATSTSSSGPKPKKVKVLTRRPKLHSLEKTVAAPTSEKMEIEYAEAAPSALEIIPAVTTKASVASSGLDGQHGGHGSLASTGVSGRARERAGLSEMRQGRESRCGRGSKRS